MSLRSTRTATRLGILAAGGALAALTVAGPAAALDGSNNGHPPVYKGRVTAKSGLLLRDAPTRGSRVVRSEPYGKVVTIFCKTTGDTVGRNNLWYLLTDGTWAWGAAHYIANIGQAPRWC
ncbi:SH3 domain-containing protein [Streptomyces kanamyceticus]|uniref:SH3 domain-containing protein n=1 Tax=Streptomyces kanamyceticus TaxID=1967 RepID=A0A5J6G9Y3_STRKN|nr:SH3 domain-containing protein [Streptomyces kanamyceticus]QEU91843.1 SH3 domain-containing protein [Streptomyces kanamyceticus]